MAISTTIVDYQVLTDAPFTLDASTNNSEKTLNFEVPPDFAFGTGVRACILSFKVRPMADSVLKFFLNNREVVTESLDKSHTRAWWEVFPASVAFPEGSSFGNPVPLRIICSDGKAALSDLIVWYQIKR